MRFKFVGMIVALSSLAIFADAYSLANPLLAVMKLNTSPAKTSEVEDSVEYSLADTIPTTSQNENIVENSNIAVVKLATKNPEPAFCTQTYDQPINHPSNERTQRLEIGANYTYAKITPKDNLSMEGSLGGAQILYEYRPLKSVYAGTAFNWRDGTTKNSVGKRSLMDFNVQERLGYSFGRTTYDSRWTLFSGFGCRYLAETVTVSGSSVDFDYTEFYVPVGFLFEARANSSFSFGCNIQWMPQVLPMVNIAPLNGTRWKLSYRLANLLAELPLIFSWSDCFSLMVVPFVESWNDGHSTAKTSTGLTLGLPSNKYFFGGVNVNFAFKF